MVGWHGQSHQEAGVFLGTESSLTEGEEPLLLAILASNPRKDTQVLYYANLSHNVFSSLLEASFPRSDEHRLQYDPTRWKWLFFPLCECIPPNILEITFMGINKWNKQEGNPRVTHEDKKQYVHQLPNFPG